MKDTPTHYFSIAILYIVSCATIYVVSFHSKPSDQHVRLLAFVVQRLRCRVAFRRQDHVASSRYDVAHQADTASDQGEPCLYYRV